jgi:hypothetical protein
MKGALGAFAALFVAGIVYIQPAHAQVQVQPAPGFSVQIEPGGTSAAGTAARGMA